MVALGCGAFAVLCANASALLPESFLSGLHASRLSGGNFDTLRTQVADLESQVSQLHDANKELLTRFSLAESTSKDVTRRVGALEVTLPKLPGDEPAGDDLDRSLLTASIGTDSADKGETYNADGGKVTVHEEPMASTSSTPGQPAQGLPPVLTAEANPTAGISPVYGVAVGPSTDAANAGSVWDDLTRKVGPLLMDYQPILAGDAKHVVAGPVQDLAKASMLCKRLEAVAVACLPVPYTGTAIKQ
jgi:hypothetical protein